MDEPIIDASRVPAAFHHVDLAMEAFKAGFRWGQKRYRALRDDNANLSQLPPPEFRGRPLVERAWLEGDNAGYLREFDRLHTRSPQITDAERQAVERDDPEGIGGPLAPALVLLLLLICGVTGCLGIGGCCAARGSVVEDGRGISPVGQSEAAQAELYGKKLPAKKVARANPDYVAPPVARNDPNEPRYLYPQSQPLESSKFEVRSAKEQKNNNAAEAAVVEQYPGR